MSGDKPKIDRVPGDECPNCGKDTYGDETAVCRSKAGNMMCRNCAFTWSVPDTVPKDDLRELVEEWREEYDGKTPRDIVNGGHQMRARGIYKCADELEQVLEDE